MQDDGRPAPDKPDSNEDLHMCGLCKNIFNEINQFIEHKQSCVKKKSDVEAIESRKATKKSEDFQFKSVDAYELIELEQSSSSLVTFNIPDNHDENDDSQNNDRFAIQKDEKSEQNQDANELFDDESLFELLSKKDQLIPGIHKLTTSLGNDLMYSHVMGENGRKFKCEFDSKCIFSTYYLKDLERHYRIHTGEKPYVCPVCNRSFNRSDKLKLHQRSHTGEKPYKCQDCSYASSDRSSLVKHIRTHTDERPFKCQICPYASRNSSQLVVHLRTHTGDAPFRCSKCTAAFKINSDLKRHMRMHSGEKPFACEYCDYRSAIKGNLRNHIKLNHGEGKQMKCSHCEFVATSRKLLKEHLREHTTKALRCSYCSYTTSSRSALNNHNRIHTNEKPYQCNFCDYSCRQACNLRTHTRKKHPQQEISPDKKNRKTKDQTELIMNQTEFSSIKKEAKPKGSRALCQISAKFPCHLCECSFVREDSLRSHLRHHQDFVPQQTAPAALAILQLHQELNVNDLHTTTIEKVDSDEVIETVPQEAEFEIVTSEDIEQEVIEKPQDGKNAITVQSQLYAKLMEGKAFEESDLQVQTVTRRGRPTKKTIQRTETPQRLVQEIQPQLRILTQNSAGQFVYQIPANVRVIPMTTVNQPNSTVLIINNQTITSNDSIISNIVSNN